MLTVKTATIRGWENGTIPLFSVPYDQIKQLAGALSQPGTQPNLLRELVIASQCDLLITRMLDATEDYAEVPPIDEDTLDGAIARDLLHWAFANKIPDRDRDEVRHDPLIDHRDKLRIADVSRQLSVGAHGPNLLTFGDALSEVTRAGWARRRQH